MKTGKNGAQSLVAYAADVLQRRPFDPAAPLKSLFMLNTPQQKSHLYGLLSTIHAYEAASSFPDNDTRLVSLEQQYRDELQILLNSLACEPLEIAGARHGTLEAIGNAARSAAMFDPVANRDGVGCNHEWMNTGGDTTCAKCGEYAPF